ncbi:hypothetical protein GC176_26935 [bacterium]|nr:hypothetical protein [bacterium]
MRQSNTVKKLQERQWRGIACGLQTGVWLVAAVVLSRRVSGDASGLATQWAACLVGSIAMAVSVLATSLLKEDDARTSNPDNGLLPEALSLLPGMMLGLALLPPGSGAGLAALLGVFAVALGTQVSFASLNRSREIRALEPAPRRSGEIASEDVGTTPCLVRPATEASVDVGDSGSLTASDALSTEVDSMSEDGAPASLLRSGPETRQWMSRSVQEGYEVVEGETRVRFEPGQRLVALHLPFSPPLTAAPEFECECLDDVAVSFRTTARHSYGIRVEVSRSGSLDQPAVANIGWTASAESTAAESLTESRLPACDAA